MELGEKAIGFDIGDIEKVVHNYGNWFKDERLVQAFLDKQLGEDNEMIEHKEIISVYQVYEKLEKFMKLCGTSSSSSS